MKYLDLLKQLQQEPSTNAKKVLLSDFSNKYPLLELILYLGLSKRIRFYIKQIPDYVNVSTNVCTIESDLDKLAKIYNREITGNAAKDYLKEILESSSEPELIERIVLKDLKIGVGRTEINKVIPKLIEKPPYMGAISYNEDKLVKLLEKEKVLYSQLKMDGRYANAIIEEGKVYLESRDGSPTYLDDFPFVKELEKFPNCVLNGELTISNTDRYTSNGIIASLVSFNTKLKEGNLTQKELSKLQEKFYKKHGTEPFNIVYTVWDYLTLEEYDNASSDKPYKERFNTLKDLISEDSINIDLIPSVTVRSISQIKEQFIEAINNNQEGLVIKSLEGKYKSGKPVYQIKYKLEETYDLRVTAFNYGTKGTKNENVISTMDVVSGCGLLKTTAGGIKEEEMQDITNRQEELLNTIVEIKCCGLSKNREGEYSLLHPSFVRFRDDKTEADSLKV